MAALAYSIASLKRSRCANCASSPGIAARIVSGFQTIDVQDQVRKITQSTLVLHARNDLRVPFEEGRLMAASLPKTRFIIPDPNVEQ
jgi:pimeloyl-ACP methyl ester carboxylesterase